MQLVKCWWSTTRTRCGDSSRRWPNGWGSRPWIRRDVAIILSSGFEEFELTERFDGYDMAGFIQKPYKLAKLRDILRRVHDVEP
jgi:hypothetical protein